ncbi:glucuronate isomerase [Pontiella sulfatireligans]|uniref:Uronate isomerase n=1 Tax=Pontiella sulfatireligans TaxID=2750658 RepID=A0A6C2UW91_9BACT|nr:glucuronate isomerase [Pontiella sulfatireligans]VGO23106.1 Uronate isomerase [Pontiella sulfatireligans]
MKKFMDADFLLQTKTAIKLYHEHAAHMPIYDYHCHLSAQEVAEDKQYDNIGECWLGGDHYKWRGMRTNGIEEKYCTGDASWRDKFQKWAETVPQTLRNPLYHWTHLELQRYFDIDTLLSPATADEIYEECTAKLRTPEFSARNLMRKMNVKLVCTTDDPVDDLRWHKQLQDEGFEIKVLPAFRPDKAMNISDPKAYKRYVKQLSEASGVEIVDFATLMEAVDLRHEYFHSVGCRLSDHGVAYVPDAEADSATLDAIFCKVMRGGEPTKEEADAYLAASLYIVGKLNHTRGWAQQFHVGVFRNNNSRLFKALGPDTGFDSIADYRQGPGMIRLLDRLDSSNQLTKTILYNINPGDNELFATMIGNYQDGSYAGKMQFGSGWWFLDQKDGMEKQMNALSNLGLLSRFVGMLTDSRSFLSYPRHEYFRRILCNLIGNDVENGEIPADMELLGQMVENICYNNAVEYFGIEL